MTAYYRNRETGLVQSHPKSGLGEFFNADEIGQDGKAVKPYTSLAPTKDELKRTQSLMKTNTPEATTGNGSAKTQKGDQ